MRLLVWLLRAAVFFALFAFALNNQHDAVLKWFFGYEWRTRMVFVVLAAFALGSAFGVLAMVPSWWRHRRVVRRQEREAAAAQAESAPAAVFGTLPNGMRYVVRANKEPKERASLRLLIEAKGVTQAQAAKEAGIAESTVSEVLAGKRKLNRTQIGKLTRYFHVGPGAFAV